MALIVNNVTSASETVTYNYLSEEECFGATRQGSYTINISDAQFDDNSTPLLSGIEALKAAYRQKQIAANIAGHIYNRGRLISLNFDETSLVGSVNATIVIEENIFIQKDAPIFVDKVIRPHHLESFEENYSFNRQDDSYSYTRNLSVKYKEKSGAVEFLEEIQLFLSDYFVNNRLSYGYQTDGISENARFDEGFYGKISESIDLLSLSVSLTENFDSGEIDVANNVGVKKTYTLSEDEDGYQTKDINITLSSLAFNSRTTLQTAVKNIVDSTVAAETISLISSSKGFTVDGREASITLKFSANPKNKTQGDNIVFSCSKSQTSDNRTYTLNISYSSADGTTNAEKFTNTVNFWTSQDHTNDDSYVKRLFSGETTLYETNRNTKFDYAGLKISETVAFSNEDLYQEVENGIIKYSLVGNSNNIKKSEEEYRHKIGFQISTKKDFFESNKKAKLTTVSVTLNVSFTEVKRPTIMTFMKNATRASDILSYAQEISDVTNLYLQSDSINVDYGSYSATRSVSFIGY
jgi:hypothetical protein